MGNIYLAKMMDDLPSPSFESWKKQDVYENATFL
jgi:hypothetical protein